MRANKQRARIRGLLIQRGKTQRDVARVASDELGEPVTEAMVSYVISGDRGEGPKAEAIKRAVARVTGRPQSELFD